MKSYKDENKKCSKSRYKKSSMKESPNILNYVSTSRWDNKEVIDAYNYSMNNSMDEKLKQIISKFPDDIPDDSVIVDFGTGTGILAIELVIYFPKCLIIGTYYGKIC